MRKHEKNKGKYKGFVVTDILLEKERKKYIQERKKCCYY